MLTPPLSPSNLAELRIATGVPVPDPPNPKYKIDLESLPRVIETSRPSGWPTDVVAPTIIPTDDGGVLAVMDKPHPHSLLELMVMQAAQPSSSGIGDLSEDELRLSLFIVSRFGSFCRRDDTRKRFGLGNSVVRCGFNYDPFTRDRPGIQPERRFHLHLYVLLPSTLEVIRTSARAYGTLASGQLQRRMVDPLAFLGTSLLGDLHRGVLSLPKGLVALRTSARSVVSGGMSLGFQVAVAGGWPAVGEPWFAEYLRKMHGAMSTASRDLLYAFTGHTDPAPVGSRFDPLPRATVTRSLSSIDWLSDLSRDGLAELASWLQPASPTLLRKAGRHRRLATHYLVLNGLAYTIGIAPSSSFGPTSDAEPMLLDISVRMFSDVGGAGLFACEGVSCVLLERGRGVFTLTEMSERRAFQRAFLAQLRDDMKVVNK